MRCSVSVLLLFLSFPLCVRGKEEVIDFEKNDGVVSLTSENFDEFLKENSSMLVMFYASWCGHCKNLYPEYVRAAARSNIPFAKVNVDREKSLEARFKITGYPTLKFWLDEIGPETFPPEIREEEEIVNWVSERTDASEVALLTGKNFTEFLWEHEVVLLKFFSPGCAACKVNAHEFEKAAKQLKKKNSKVRLAKIDGMEERDIGNQYGIKKFPTLHVVKNGKKYPYKRTELAAQIVHYMEKIAAPVKKLSTLNEVDQFISEDDVSIIGFFATEEGNSFENFLEAADLLVGESFYRNSYTLDPAALKKYAAKPNDIFLFLPTLFLSKFEPAFMKFNQSVRSTPQEIVKFAQDNCLPLVGKMTKGIGLTRYTGRPLVVVYYSADFSLSYREGSEYWRKKILPIANKYAAEKYRFAIADEDEFAEELKVYGLGDSSLEHNVVLFGADDKVYPMSPDEFDGELVENLEQFVKNIKMGKVKSISNKKSAPLPKNDNSPVKTVVYSNFNKVVMDESKDVLLEIYAPWCGHCKALEPKFAELAASLKKSEPNLVLAKLDATANDLPVTYSAEAYPTIYFAPAGKKETPIKYNGSRDTEDLKRFMKENAVKSFQKKEEL